MGVYSGWPRVRSWTAIVLGIAVAVLSILSGPAAGPVQAQQGPSDYVLNPGDQIEILVYGEADVTRGVTIRPDGKITLPFVGDVQAAGLTTVQLTEKITVALTTYIKHPKVTITVREFARAYVFLVGQVARGGQVEIQRGWTMLDLMASTGGVTPRAALRRATLTRRGNGQIIALDLERLLVKGDRSADVYLEAGDIIMVPAMQNRVLIFGAVRGTGAFDLEDGARFLDAMAAAGGPVARAGTNNIGVIRTGPDGKPMIIAVNLDRILKGDMSLNIAMQNQDVIYVPQGPFVRWQDVLAWLTSLGVIRSLAGSF